MNIEHISIGVTVAEAASADGAIPTWRDTIFLELSSPTLTGAQLSALKTNAITEALGRHAAWKQAILNPPAPAPETVPTVDEAVTQAQNAVQQAMDALNAVAAAQTAEG